MKCPFCMEEIADNSEKCSLCNSEIMKPCPFCAEKIRADALKCKHCGSLLNDKQHTVMASQQPQAAGSVPDSSRKAEVNTTKSFPSLKLIISVVSAVILIAALIIGIPKYKTYRIEAKRKAAKEALIKLKIGLESYFADNQNYPDSIDKVGYKADGILSDFETKCTLLDMKYECVSAFRGGTLLYKISSSSTQVSIEKQANKVELAAPQLTADPPYGSAKADSYRENGQQVNIVEISGTIDFCTGVSGAEYWSIKPSNGPPVLIANVSEMEGASMGPNLHQAKTSKRIVTISGPIVMVDGFKMFKNMDKHSL